MYQAYYTHLTVTGTLFDRTWNIVVRQRFCWLCFMLYLVLAWTCALLLLLFFVAVAVVIVALVVAAAAVAVLVVGVALYVGASLLFANG